MAKLLPDSYILPPIVHDWTKSYKEWDHHKAFETLCEKHEMFSTGVADGYAWYIVVKRKPLTLQHVDYMDGWHAPAALIRGLRLSDIDANTRRLQKGFKF